MHGFAQDSSAQVTIVCTILSYLVAKMESPSISAGIGLCANVWDTDERDVYPISFLAYVVVPTVNSNRDCPKMKIVYDFLNWAITDPAATFIATNHDYASLPVKFAKSVLNNFLNTMKCSNDDSSSNSTYRLIINEPPTSQALTVQGSGSNMMQGLLAALLNEYSGAGNDDPIVYCSWA